MTTAKRLAWVGTTHAKVPGVLTYLIASMRPRGAAHGARKVKNLPLLRAKDRKNLAEAQRLVRQGDDRRHGADRLLPWAAAQLRKTILRVRSGEVGDVYLESDIYNLQGFLAEIADWAAAERPDMKDVSIPQAVDRMHRWHERLAAEAKDLAAKPGFVVAELDGGWQVHDLGKSPEGELLFEPAVSLLLRSEGEAMGICVGGSTYARDVARGGIEIYSLRDPSGRPHITIEVDGNEQVIKQFRGKGNTRPKAVYCSKILPWLEATWDSPLDLGEAIACLGPQGAWEVFWQHGSWPAFTAVRSRWDLLPKPIQDLSSDLSRVDVTWSVSDGEATFNRGVSSWRYLHPSGPEKLVLTVPKDVEDAPRFAAEVRSKMLRSTWDPKDRRR